jgi:CubicO group peptidase (beta-lactamase class C family)
MSKVITAAAVMMLYEEGRFELSDPVSNFLPEFKHMKVLDPPVPQDHTSPPGALVDAKRPITIMHLLNHTAGLTYPWDNRLGKVYVGAHVGTGLRQQDSTLAESIQRLATLPLLFQPGDYSEYSLSFDVLGRLVEVVSGMPYDKFLEERLFKPLGMKDTYFFLPEDKVARLATAYGYNEHQGLYPILDGQIQAVPTGMGDMFEYTADYPYRGPRTYFSGGVGLNGTIEDYYRFCQMILNGGELNGVRILSPKTVEFMTRNHSPAIPGVLRWGFGVIVYDDPQEMTELGSLNSFGGGGYYYTSFVIDPHEDLIAIFMGQLSPDGNLNLTKKALRLAYQAIVD